MAHQARVDRPFRMVGERAGDRFFAVLSGTWWMGTGETFDPERTVPAPAGSYVIHYGGKVHYDGAKNEEAWVLIVGEGPGTLSLVEMAK